MEEIYKPKISKMIGMFILCFVLLCLGILVLFLPGTGSILVGIIMILLFGTGSFLSIANAFNGSYLKLTDDGFEVKFSFKKYFTNWKDVKSFSVTPITSNRFVSYTFSDSYNKQEIGRNIAKSLSGSEAILPDSFGKKPEELAEIMNNWKKKSR